MNASPNNQIAVNAVDQLVNWYNSDGISFDVPEDHRNKLMNVLKALMVEVDDNACFPSHEIDELKENITEFAESVHAEYGDLISHYYALISVINRRRKKCVDCLNLACIHRLNDAVIDGNTIRSKVFEC